MNDDPVSPRKSHQGLGSSPGPGANCGGGIYNAKVCMHYWDYEPVKRIGTRERQLRTGGQ